MKLKKIFQYGFVAICLFGNTMAADDKNSDEALLIVGCRPWDPNVQEVSGLEAAHFIDFMTMGAPTPLPSNFHHVDLDDAGRHSAAKFTDFAASYPEKFKAIIIDWFTGHHIGQGGVHTAWKGFEKLLRPGGQLIIPVTELQRTVSISKQKAQELIDQRLTGIFDSIEIITYGALPVDKTFDLLRRHGMGITQAALSFLPAIIIATKELVVAGKEAFNPPVSGEHVSEKIDEKLSIKPEMRVEKITMFKAPSVEELKQQLSAPAFSKNPLFQKEGLVLKPVVHPHDSINSIVSRVSMLKSYHATYLIDKEGKLDRVVFGYSRDGGKGIELSVDFGSMGVDSGTVKYDLDDWYLITAPGYKTSFNPGLQFKIG